MTSKIVPHPHARIRESAVDCCGPVGKEVISETAFETFTATSVEIAKRSIEAAKRFYAIKKKKEKA